MGRISSFEVVDRLIAKLVTRHSRIREVVVVGNSAGGQFTQRYAALSRSEDLANANGRRVKFRYLVSNPSSYLYFDAKRVSSSGTIEMPSETILNECPKYNSYGYGLDEPNAYAKRSSPAEIEARFPRRNVVYFIGNDDDDQDHPGLDTRCAADLQGPERFSRSRNYWRHLLEKFGPEALTRQTRICIESGTHNVRTILGTPCGRFYLSGTGDCPPSPCPD
jgi:hypothetical protein